jgi:CubicO group peptidase (beta-lactamase class C family)
LALLLGSVPTRLAATNGIVIYKGYVVAEFGETTAVDPTYSAAKSMIATVAGIAVRDGLIRLDEPVGKLIRDGGYDSPQNVRITWKMHLSAGVGVGGRDVRQEARLCRSGRLW